MTYKAKACILIYLAVLLVIETSYLQYGVVGLEAFLLNLAAFAVVATWRVVPGEGKR